MDLDAVFKAYDIRGRAPDQLDEDVARRVGGAFARFAAAPRVAVGRDCRLSSPALAAAFTEGVTAQGADVFDIGEATTDMLYFVSGKRSVPGAMITASHNPPEYNGIKLCLAGAVPVGAESGLAEIKQGAETDIAVGEGEGTVAALDVVDEYVDHMLGVVGDDGLGDAKVVADGGNGMAGVVLPAIFSRITPHLDGLYLEPDGTFPNHPADPLRPENLEDLMARMAATSAHLGVAFDGDADRAFFVDDERRPVSGSTTTAIVASWFLRRDPGAAVVHNLITSRAVPETIVAYGGRPVRTRVGHSYIKQVMAETDAVFGGEHSGHYYFRANYRADSGILALLVLLRVLAEAAVPLSQLRAEFEPYHQSGEINLEVADKEAVLEGVASSFDGTVDRLDGVTVSWDDRWFNLRPSNTEPVLRLNVEAGSPEAVAELVHEVEESVAAHGR